MPWLFLRHCDSSSWLTTTTLPAASDTPSTPSRMSSQYTSTSSEISYATRGTLPPRSYTLPSSQPA
ncbi:MAG: hypothetical protein MUF34_03135 [Polyangiaceae bacterium]|nr:hypothetical protein [Polyangiaceae bacterium]